ncbi:MAG: GNAT family N-acetyltransferase [Hyphomonadaceae bacterium]|nr:GNAT family N-acetyltransferase [Hyphomonadaceae bacterium]
MNLHAPGLEDELVRLEPFEQGHVAYLKDFGAVEAMWDWMPDIPTGKSADAYAAHICSLQKRGTLVAFTMFRQSDNAFAGVVDYDFISRTHRRVRISNFWYTEEARGKGFFQASQCLLIRRALDWGAKRVGWIVPAEAKSAVRAIERLGAKQEGLLRSYYRFAGGGWADMALHAMLRDEAELALHRIKLERELAEDKGDSAS